MPSLRLAQYMREDLVFWDLPRLDKSSFVKVLAARVAALLPPVNEQDLVERLLAREAEQSTGIGGGLALPHALAPGIEKTVLVVGRVHEGLDFAALDSEPVDLVFLLLSPSNAETQHLRLLARLARIFTGEEMLEKLRSAKGPDELFRILLDEDARHVY